MFICTTILVLVSFIPQEIRFEVKNLYYLSFLSFISEYTVYMTTIAHCVLDVHAFPQLMPEKATRRSCLDMYTHLIYNVLRKSQYGESPYEVAVLGTRLIHDADQIYLHICIVHLLYYMFAYVALFDIVYVCRYSPILKK